MTQQQKFHTDDANNLHHQYGIINVYIINPAVMGFQQHYRFVPILCVFWSILVKCCVHLPTSSSKNSNASSREDYIPQIVAVLLEILRVYI